MQANDKLNGIFLQELITESMRISIASGKGGTGKTTVAVNFAVALGRELNLIDCDVEEPDAHIFFQNTRPKRVTEVNLPVPEIMEEKCSSCGLCAYCKFNAIAVVKGKVLLFPELCRSCGLCSYLCPENAIVDKKVTIGEIEFFERENINLKSGKLKIGEQFGSPVIWEVKKQKPYKNIEIIDCPPGTGTPVLEAVYNTDFCILVAEQNVFGLHDLKLTIKGIQRLKIPFGVIINKYRQVKCMITDYCRHNNYEILMKIPYDKDIAVEYSNGKLFIDKFPEFYKEFRKLYSDIINIVQTSTY